MSRNILFRLDSSIHCPILQGQHSSTFPTTVLFHRHAPQERGEFPGVHPLNPRKRSGFINSGKWVLKTEERAGPGPAKGS